MTDPEMADRTYVEPLTVEVARRRSSSASGPTRCCRRWAARPALNLAIELAETGVLEQYGVELIGAKLDAIKKAEDRELFKDAMMQDRPRRAAQRRRALAGGGRCEFARELGFPLIIRPSFTLGGTGGGIAYNPEEFARRSLGAASRCRPVHEVLVEESVLGWKEFELEVMRDARTTSSSSARSRTSIRWACTPATRSPSRRRRR